MSNRIDAEVSRIINHCEQLATRIVRDNRVIIDLIVERLLDTETLNGDEFRDLVKQYTIPPVKN
jgi:cell division protease FtsH